ncbi:MAG: CHAD domain-containing protein [Methylococcus sp.]|nr:CHAD domain-containing protein [Methylococcus sp.]
MVRNTEDEIATPSGRTAAPQTLAENARADAAVRWYCSQQLERMRSCEKGILENRDPEALHDYRVALRRSRALLGQMKGIFPERDVRRCLQVLQRLGELTGPLRDHQVMLAELPAFEALLPESLRPALAPLRSRLEQTSDSAYRCLSDALVRPAYRHSLESWHRFVRRPAPKLPSAPNARRSVGEVCGRRIWKLYRRMLRDGAALGPESRPEAFHALRKHGKKLRYLLEFFAQFHARGKVKALVAQLKKLQDVLGEYQDSAVQQDRLVGLGRILREEGQPLETLLAIGVLVGHLEQRQAHCRQAFHEGYEAFAKKSTRQLFRRLFAPERSETEPTERAGTLETAAGTGGKLPGVHQQ